MLATLGWRRKAIGEYAPDQRWLSRRLPANSTYRRPSRFAYNEKFARGNEAPLLRVRRNRSARMIMDIVEIQKFLPHRYPFLMVDGILEMERLKRIVGVK